MRLALRDPASEPREEDPATESEGESFVTADAVIVEEVPASEPGEEDPATESAGELWSGILILLGDLGPHAKFQNPITKPYGRKVTRSEEEK